MITQISYQDPNIRSLWDTIASQNMPNAPFFTPAWNQLWQDTLNDAWEPWTLLVDNKVLAPLARKDNQVILASELEATDYSDIVGAEYDKGNAWPQLLDYLTSQNIRTLEFHNVPQSSATLRFFEKPLYKKELVTSCTITKEDTTPIVRLPKDWETYLSALNPKRRHELTRKIRKFKRDFPHAIVGPGTNPAQDIEALLTLMKMNAHKNTFLTPRIESFFQKLATSFSSETLHIDVLSIDGANAAATLSFATDSAILLYNSGFDETHYPGSGFYLKAMNIKQAISRGVNVYNFLQGSERYKYELGAVDFFVYRIDVTLNS